MHNLLSATQFLKLSGDPDLRFSYTDLATFSEGIVAVREEFSPRSLCAC